MEMILGWCGGLHGMVPGVQGCQGQDSCAASQRTVRENLTMASTHDLILDAEWGLLPWSPTLRLVSENCGI